MNTQQTPIIERNAPIAVFALDQLSLDLGLLLRV